VPDRGIGCLETGADAERVNGEQSLSGQTTAEFRAWLFTQLREMGTRVSEREEALRDYSARLDVLRARHR
jgi:hypothetical protein